MKMKIAGLILAIISICLGLFVEIEGLPFVGSMALFTLAAGVFLWICGTFPVGISGLLLMLILIISGATQPGPLVSAFTNPTLLFLIFAFSFGMVLKKTAYSEKLVGLILKVSKANSKRLVLGFLIVPSIVSWFMSNLATVVIFMPIGVALLESLGHKKLQSNLGKCMMIGLAVCAMVGGAATPIGAGQNILLQGLLMQTVGYQISFAAWSAVGIPTALVICGIVYFSLTRFYKPETLDPTKVAELVKEFDALPPASTKDKISLVSLIVIVVLLIAGTWVPVLTALNVGIAALVWFTFPGINLLTWDDIVEAVSWESFVMFGTVNAIVSVLVSTGAAAWLAAVMTGLIGAYPAIVILLLFGIITQLLHSICPFGPGLIAMVFAPFVGIAVATGAFSPAVVPLLLAFTLGAAFIVPINLPFIVTMGSGWWKAKDSLLPGILPCAALIVILALWLPLGLSIFGY